MSPVRRLLAATLPVAGTLMIAAPFLAGPAPVRARAPQEPQGQTAKSVTPDTVIDTKSVVDVVREEVRGGEAAKGGSPATYLWDFPDESLIQDEPLTVEVPLGLQTLYPVAVVPAANPLTKGRYELGRQLYFEPRVSKDGTVSCATCHNPDTGWTAQLPTAVGIAGQVGGRNSPTVINTAYGKTMFWDGRAPSLEGQAQGPIQNPIEMGNQSYKEIIERLRAIPGYKEQFRKVFGTDVTLDGFAKAVATFERVASLSGNSAYDKYRSNDFQALTESQKRGMILFGLTLENSDPDKAKLAAIPLKKANCTSCHAGFNFTDELFHNLGVGWDTKTRRFVDLGRWAVEPIGAKFNKNLGAFKTPTIRDAAKTGPYMHDGSEQTLMDVVNYYDKGGNANPYLDRDMKKLNLTDQEKKDLVAFMEGLTGATKKVELPKLPPGPDGKSPDPKVALEIPKAKAAVLRDTHDLIRTSAR